jgi:hypothetical protein
LVLLEQAILEAKAYCKSLGIDIETILNYGENGFKEIELFQDYANIILAKDDYKRQLGLYVNTIVSLYDSAKPEIYDLLVIKKNRDVFQYLPDIVDRKTDADENIENANKRIDELLDTSVVVQEWHKENLLRKKLSGKFNKYWVDCSHNPLMIEWFFLRKLMLLLNIFMKKLSMECEGRRNFNQTIFLLI